MAAINFIEIGLGRTLLTALPDDLDAGGSVVLLQDRPSSNLAATISTGWSIPNVVIAVAGSQSLSTAMLETTSDTTPGCLASSLPQVG